MERISYQDLPQGMFEQVRNIETYLAASPLDHALLELMKLRISQLNQCAYCVDMHYKELEHSGETALRISLLPVWKEASVFSPKERAVLTFAESLSNTVGTLLTDEDYTPLNSFFNKEEICYLTLAVTQINTWNMLMKTFQFESGNYQVQK